jgi:GxxExxY protein
MKTKMKTNEITDIIIQCAIKVHKVLGPGLLESVYHECLYYELMKTGLIVEKEKGIPIIYDEIKLGCGFRADIIVENRVIIELKSVEAIHSIFVAQILTYLKLTNYHVGILINFNVLKLTDGLKRVVNNYDDEN